MLWTISVFGINMRSLKLADLCYFENHCSHFCVTNPAKFSKRRAKTDNLKSINPHQLFSRQISTTLLQSPPSCATKSLPLLCAFFNKQCPFPNSCNDCKSEGVAAENFNQNVAYIFTPHTSCITKEDSVVFQCSRYLK